MQRTAGLAEQLRSDEIVVAPGIYDALTAFMAEKAGFTCLYLSGAAVAYTRLARPDVGLVTATEMAATLALVRETVSIPVVVDGDTGYGNALNVQRTVRLFEQAGASAIQLEDQTFPKRCGHLADKSVVSAEDMIGKIRAAVDTRRSSDMLIVARTDAVAIEGVAAAVDRAARYTEAGADVLFVEAPRSREDLASIRRQLGSATPLMANMVEGGHTPSMSASELQELGYSLVIFPGGIVRAFALVAQEYYASLKAHGSNAPYGGRMLDFPRLNELLGTADLLKLAASYEHQGKSNR